MNIWAGIFFIMEIITENIERIGHLWFNMKTIDELLYLLNFVQSTVFDERAKPIDIKTLNFFCIANNSESNYRKFEIKKKSGGSRIIMAPKEELKVIQQILNIIFQHLYFIHHDAFGFVPQKSIKDNAYQHVGRRYVYNIDLKDFFHSFNRERLTNELLMSSSFLRLKNREIASVVASLCTVNISLDEMHKTILPQGSPCSPVITNILSFTLDRRLKGLAKRFGANYSRYADDISFSSNHNLYKEELFIKELKRIISDQKLQINDKKNSISETMLQTRGYWSKSQPEGQCPNPIFKADTNVVILLGRIRLQ